MSADALALGGGQGQPVGDRDNLLHVVAELLAAVGIDPATRVPTARRSLVKQVLTSDPSCVGDVPRDKVAHE
jgi:hypothetical protein